MCWCLILLCRSMVIKILSYKPCCLHRREIEMLARDDHIFYQNLLKGKTNMFRAGRNQNNIAFNLNITKCQNPWNWHLSTIVHFHIFLECFSLPKLHDSLIQLHMIWFSYVSLGKLILIKGCHWDPKAACYWLQCWLIKGLRD